MTQLFAPDIRSRIRQIALMVILLLLLILGGVYYNAFYHTEYCPQQPIAFSHKTHIALGIGCLTCHPAATHSTKAGLPDASSCMACHRHIKPDSPRIIPIRRAADPNYIHYTGHPIPWIMVNTWAGHARFSHQAHVTRGVGCITCHNDITSMDQTTAPQNRGMRWCIDCHKAPAPSLRLLQDITTPIPTIRLPKPEQQGTLLQKKWLIAPPINDCSACHH
ncbi:MAG: cytochrome c3 family protein [Akkermansia sp.]